MAHGSGGVTYIASIEVHCTGVALGCKQGQSAFAFDKIQPFVGVGVPVQFPECSGFQFNKGSGYGFGDGEVIGVDDAYLAALGDYVRLLFVERV